MRRTVFFSDDYSAGVEGEVFYREKSLGWLLSYLARHFKMEYGNRYAVTIVEGTKYTLISDGGSYEVRMTDEPDINLGFICREVFEKLFFIPDADKTYNITVKKVK